KREAFELFSDMLDRIKQDVVKYVLTVQVRSQQDVQAVEEAPAVSNVRYQHADYEEALAAPAHAAPRRAPGPVSAGGPEGRSQRSMSVRIRQEIQALPRQNLEAVSHATARPDGFVVFSARPPLWYVF